MSTFCKHIVLYPKTLSPDTPVRLTRFEVIPTSYISIRKQSVRFLLYFSFVTKLTKERTHFLVVLFRTKGCLISKHSQLSEAYVQAVNYLCE
jgi:hypothetical protein